MNDRLKYEVTIEDPEIDDLFQRYVGYERTTTNKVINTAILLYLSMQVGLTSSEREIIRAKAKAYRKKYNIA